MGRARAPGDPEEVRDGKVEAREGAVALLGVDHRRLGVREPQ